MAIRVKSVLLPVLEATYLLERPEADWPGGILDAVWSVYPSALARTEPRAENSGCIDIDLVDTILVSCVSPPWLMSARLLQGSAGALVCVEGVDVRRSPSVV